VTGNRRDIRIAGRSCPAGETIAAQSSTQRSKARSNRPVAATAPPIAKRIDFRVGGGGDTAQQTLNKLPGYWLTDVASSRKHRLMIESCIADSMEKAYRLRAVDEAESQR
jgi:hypothetical protein